MYNKKARIRAFLHTRKGIIMNKFYITTTLPYVNSKPHMGHALEFVQADILARYHRDIAKDEVLFNTGTDEHGMKIYRKAQEAGKDTQVYVDEYAGTFELALKNLDISYTDFIRTTNPHHKAAAQEFWKRCDANGDIYKKTYQIKYCVGCELEKTESELVNGKCPLHPNLELELIDEENYFFRFSKYQQPLLDFYEQHPDFVVPDFRFNEIKQFAKGGLQDFSISRLKSKMPWGVPVPGDDTQVMYVWFDALINYISTLGWPENGKKFEEFWGTKDRLNAIQIAGKDNLRQQTAMWQAMLMSAGLPNSKQVIIHGFITSDGEKMSKTLGNVIDPMEIVEKYGAEALRYWFAREMSTFEDGDFTVERFKESYNAGLANGIGNLTSRILKMAQNLEMELPKAQEAILEPTETFCEFLDKYEIQKAAQEAWAKIGELDAYIQRHEPFKLAKTEPEKAKEHLEYLLKELMNVAYMLSPILPQTSAKILTVFNGSKVTDIPKLFPRLE